MDTIGKTQTLDQTLNCNNISIKIFWYLYEGRPIKGWVEII